MKSLRYIRIVLSVVLALIATLLVAVSFGWAKQWLGWIENIQLMQAALSLSVGVCIFWIALTFAFGRAYCSSVCPLGTFQDFFAFLNKRMFCHGHGNYHFSRAENRLRYVILGVVVICVIAYQWFIPSLTDPFSIFKGFVSTAVGKPHTGLMGCAISMLLGFVISALTFIAVAILAFRNGRTFCKTICPVGTTLSLMSRYSVFQFEIDPDLCINCGKCEQECKASCINSIEHTVDMSRCVVCLNCTSVCPNKAIRYTASRKRLSTPLMRPINDKVPQVTANSPADFNSASKPCSSPRRRSDSK
jgi:polyferredoxin